MIYLKEIKPSVYQGQQPHRRAGLIFMIASAIFVGFYPRLSLEQSDIKLLIWGVIAIMFLTGLISCLFEKKSTFLVDQQILILSTGFLWDLKKVEIPYSDLHAINVDHTEYHGSTKAQAYYISLKGQGLPKTLILGQAMEEETAIKQAKDAATKLKIPFNI